MSNFKDQLPAEGADHTEGALPSDSSPLSEKNETNQSIPTPVVGGRRGFLPFLVRWSLIFGVFILPLGILAALGIIFRHSVKLTQSDRARATVAVRNGNLSALASMPEHARLAALREALSRPTPQMSSFTDESLFLAVVGLDPTGQLSQEIMTRLLPRLILDPATSHSELQRTIRLVSQSGLGFRGDARRALISRLSQPDGPSILFPMLKEFTQGLIDGNPSPEDIREALQLVSSSLTRDRRSREMAQGALAMKRLQSLIPPVPRSGEREFLILVERMTTDTIRRYRSTDGEVTLDEGALALTETWTTGSAQVAAGMDALEEAIKRSQSLRNQAGLAKALAGLAPKTSDSLTPVRWARGLMLEPMVARRRALTPPDFAEAAEAMGALMAMDPAHPEDRLKLLAILRDELTTRPLGTRGGPTDVRRISENYLQLAQQEPNPTEHILPLVLELLRQQSIVTTTVVVSRPTTGTRMTGGNGASRAALLAIMQAWKPGPDASIPMAEALLKVMDSLPNGRDPSGVVSQLGQLVDQLPVGAPIVHQWVRRLHQEWTGKQTEGVSLPMILATLIPRMEAGSQDVQELLRATVTQGPAESPAAQAQPGRNWAILPAADQMLVALIERWPEGRVLIQNQARTLVEQMQSPLPPDQLLRKGRHLAYLRPHLSPGSQEVQQGVRVLVDALDPANRKSAEDNHRLCFLVLDLTEQWTTGTHEIARALDLLQANYQVMPPFILVPALRQEGAPDGAVDMATRMRSRLPGYVSASPTAESQAQQQINGYRNLHGRPDYDTEQLGRLAEVAPQLNRSQLQRLITECDKIVATSDNPPSKAMARIARVYLTDLSTTDPVVRIQARLDVLHQAEFIKPLQLAPLSDWDMVLEEQPALPERKTMLNPLPYLITQIQPGVPQTQVTHGPGLPPGVHPASREPVRAVREFVQRAWGSEWKAQLRFPTRPGNQPHHRPALLWEGIRNP